MYGSVSRITMPPRGGNLGTSQVLRIWDGELLEVLSPEVGGGANRK